MLIENLYKENIEKEPKILLKELIKDTLDLYQEEKINTVFSKEEANSVITSIFVKTYLIFLKDKKRLIKKKIENADLLDSIEDLELIGVDKIFNKTKLNFEKKNDLSKELLFLLIYKFAFESIKPVSFIALVSFYIGSIPKNFIEETTMIENIISRKEKDNDSPLDENTSFPMTYKKIDNYREKYIQNMKDNLLIMSEVIKEVNFLNESMNVIF